MRSSSQPCPIMVEATDPLKKYTTFAPWHNPDSLTNVDWQNALYRTGLTQNYALAIRGGNDKVQTRRVRRIL